jgi:membrane AbrB-like protein
LTSSKLSQWAGLTLLSALLISFFRAIELPAALFLGAMIAGVIFGVRGSTIRVPRFYFYFSQAVIGSLIAQMMISDILSNFFYKWPLFLAIILSILGASYAIGFGISSYKLLHHTTAFWGLLPGGSSVMIFMADAFGGDSRLVAFMQYARVLLVAVAASVLTHFYIPNPEMLTTPIPWFPHIHWHALSASLVLISLGIIFAYFTPIPAGAILIPLITGSILHLSGLVELEIPPWLLASAYIVLGWTIGMRFTPKSLSHALKTLPQTLLAIISLMVFCGFLAYLLVIFGNIDPLTAYLATSPGGMDAMAILAASTHADMPFVMALQMTRFVLILMLGPPISRWLAQRFEMTFDEERPHLIGNVAEESKKE